MPNIAVIISFAPIEAVRLLQGLSAAASQRSNWRIHPVLDIDPNWLGWTKWLNPDGVIAHFNSQEKVEALAALGKPTVNYLSRSLQLNTLAIEHDDYLVGRMAADHLLERGLKNFGYIGPNNPYSEDRARGFSALLAEKSLPCVVAGVNAPETSDGSWASVWQIPFLVDVLRHMKLPAGLLALNDGLAVRILDAAMELGLKVPEDVALIGVDNNELLCDFADITLTSVDLDLYRMGYELAQAMQDLLAGRVLKPALAVIPPRGIVTRRSTDVLKFSDPDIATAVRYIREKVGGGIDVTQVLQHVPVSRRSLEQRFRELVGHSPGEEIRRTRVQEACKLLIGTDLKLIDIAMRCGFEYASYFSRSFRREMGMTPKAYRAQHSRPFSLLGGKRD